MVKLILVVAALVIFLTGVILCPAWAGVNRRENKQAHRIKDGYKDNSLTNRESRDAAADLARIQAREAHFRSDGSFTPAERSQIQHQLNSVNDEIWRYRHNNRKK